MLRIGPKDLRRIHKSKIAFPRKTRIQPRNLGQMGNIEVHLFAAARSAVGHRTVTASGKTLAEVVASLIADYPAFAAVEPRCSYLVNGLAARGDLDLINLAAGARVDVLPPFAGG